MFCPKCGATQNDELRFCKLCGANLFAVRQAVDTGATPETFDWSKTWVAEMFMSPHELKRRKEEAERLRGITPEIKRNNEIKAGIITGCVGIGIAIFLFFFMQGIILGGVKENTAEILSRLWIAGVLPLFVGIALIINGVFVSKRLLNNTGRDSENSPRNLKGNLDTNSLGPADTTGVIPSSFSVTEDTTQQLRPSGHKQ